jgi:hypothetical protein
MYNTEHGVNLSSFLYIVITAKDLLCVLVKLHQLSSQRALVAYKQPFVSKSTKRLHLPWQFVKTKFCPCWVQVLHGGVLFPFFECITCKQPRS